MKPQILLPLGVMFLALTGCGSKGGSSSGSSGQVTPDPTPSGSISKEAYSLRLQGRITDMNNYVPGKQYTKNYLKLVTIEEVGKRVIPSGQIHQATGASIPCYWDLKEEDTILSHIVLKHFYVLHKIYIRLSTHSPKACEVFEVKSTGSRRDWVPVLEQVRVNSKGYVTADEIEDNLSMFQRLIYIPKSANIITTQFDPKKVTVADQLGKDLFVENLSRPYMYRFEMLFNLHLSPKSGAARKIDFTVNTQTLRILLPSVEFNQSEAQTSLGIKNLNDCVRRFGKEVLFDWSERFALREPVIRPLPSDENPRVQANFCRHYSQFPQDATLFPEDPGPRPVVPEETPVPGPRTPPTGPGVPPTTRPSPATPPPLVGPGNGDF